MIFQIVRFKSRLSDDQVLATYRERASRYQALPGLLQKYYLKYEGAGEHGAVYLWESEQAMQDFRQSDLARSIPDAYQVEGTPDIQIGLHVMSLRSETSVSASGR